MPVPVAGEGISALAECPCPDASLVEAHPDVGRVETTARIAGVVVASYAVEVTGAAPAERLMADGAVLGLVARPRLLTLDACRAHAASLSS